MVQKDLVFLTSVPFFIISLTSISIPIKDLLSFGSSFFTSSDWMKRFSKNDQDFYTSLKIVTTSITDPRSNLHYSTVFSKYPTYLFNNILLIYN